MNKEQIDLFFKLYLEENIEEMCKLLGLTRELEEYKIGKSIDLALILTTSAMKLIEKGDYEYFKTKIHSDNELERNIFFELMVHSSNKQDIKYLVNNRVKLKINNETTVELISNLDNEYIDEEILRKEKIDELKLTGMDVGTIIEEMKIPTIHTEMEVSIEEKNGLERKREEALIHKKNCIIRGHAEV